MAGQMAEEKTGQLLVGNGKNSQEVESGVNGKNSSTPAKDRQANLSSSRQPKENAPIDGGSPSQGSVVRSRALSRKSQNGKKQIGMRGK